MESGLHMRNAVLLACCAIFAQAQIVTLDSDRAVTRAREEYAQLMVLLHSPHDHACTVAVPLFRNLEASWRTGEDMPGNATFALADVDAAPELSQQILGERGNLPAYVLYLKGIAAPVLYRGGWSDKSISAWLRKQVALRPTEVNTLDELRVAVRASTHGLALLGFLTNPQRERGLLEVAARTAQAPAAVLLGSKNLARELGEEVVEEPCVLVVRRDDGEWPLLGGALTQVAVEAFARERAMPTLVAIGDSNRSFSQQVRQHPLQLHVLVMHRSGQHGPHEASDDALEAMRRVAARHDGEALFLSYDFFDNDPDAFSVLKVYASELPIVLAVHGRGGFNERVWRLPSGSGGEDGIDEEEIEGLVERALGSLDSKAAGQLTARRQHRVFEVPDGFWDDDSASVEHDEL